MLVTERGMVLLRALRKERRRAKKPEISPISSKVDFETEWLSKFDAQFAAWPLHKLPGWQLRNYAKWPQQASPPLHLAEKLPEYLTTAFTMLVEFNRIVDALGLDYEYFEKEPKSSYLFGAGSKLKNVHPFDPAVSLGHFVNFGVRYGEELIDKIPGWEGFQRELLHEEFEDLRVRVFVAEEDGERDTSASDDVFPDKISEVFHGENCQCPRQEKEEES